jgi:hypothetical protein
MNAQHQDQTHVTVYWLKSESLDDMLSEYLPERSDHDTEKHAMGVSPCILCACKGKQHDALLESDQQTVGSYIPEASVALHDPAAVSIHLHLSIHSLSLLLAVACLLACLTCLPCVPSPFAHAGFHSEIAKKYLHARAEKQTRGHELVSTWVAALGPDTSTSAHCSPCDGLGTSTS